MDFQKHLANQNVVEPDFRVEKSGEVNKTLFEHGFLVEHDVYTIYYVQINDEQRRLEVSVFYKLFYKQSLHTFYFPQPTPPSKNLATAKAPGVANVKHWGVSSKPI